MKRNTWLKKLSRSVKGRPRPGVRPKATRLRLDPLEDRLLLSAYTVTDPSDHPDVRVPLPAHDCDTGDYDADHHFIRSGVCSLRAAIQHIDAEAELVNTISFGVPAVGPTFPDTITAPVTIDGKGVETLTGALALGLGSPGSGGSTIKGMTIMGNAGGPGIGVYSGKNDIEGNVITGNATGVLVLGGASNTIKSNVLSSNLGDGLRLTGGATGNVVQGNWIGTDKTGTEAMGNGFKLAGSGVSIAYGATKNLIGADGSGAAADAAAANVISANAVNGIRVYAPMTDSNVVAGNFIGTDKTGTKVIDPFGKALGNGFVGVSISGGAQLNRVGTDGKSADDAGQRNIISGNKGPGVEIAGAGTNSNVLAGNYIGTDITGAKAKDALAPVSLGNGGDGVSITGGAQMNQVGTSGLETAPVDMRNVIAASKSNGVSISGMATDKNVVAGNYIGTDKTGTLAGDGPVGAGFPFGNFVAGAAISGGAQSNRVGTNADGKGDAAELNVISVSVADGVAISGPGTNSNVVAGNYVGTDSSGTLALDKFGNPLGNGANDVSITGGAQLNRIGIIGTAALVPVPLKGGNLLANAKVTGVLINGIGNDSNVVQGNYIGTNAAGTKVLPGGTGVVISGGAQFNLIGTNGDGLNDDKEGNLISGSKSSGVVITGAGTNGNYVAGNYIGTDVTGTLALTNGADGVTINTGAPMGPGPQMNIIGVDASDANPTADGNVICGNNGNGVSISDSGADLNVVAGNYIGVDSTGLSALPNKAAGVLITNGAQRNRIGVNGNDSNDLPERNIISGNAADGVLITSNIITGATNQNVVAGNFIGTDVTGHDLGGLLGNGGNGVNIQLLGTATSGAAQNNYIGTNGLDRDNTGERNVISANALNGVAISGPAANYNVVAGNFIGTESTGFFARGNGAAGVAISNGAQYNRIGSDGNGKGDVYKLNVISGNTDDGVEIYDPTTSKNVVAGNYIGVGATGTLALSNRESGVEIYNGASFNKIGLYDLDPRSTPVVVPNVISHNAQDGVEIFDKKTVGNVVQGNKIGTDVTGTLGLGNGAWGVRIYEGASGNLIGTNGDGVNDAAEGNLISANGTIGPPDQRDGVTIYGDYATGAVSASNIVAGNFIGTDVTGTLALGNGGDGVAIGQGAQMNQIGTSGKEVVPAAMANVISANALNGVEIALLGTDSNVVAGNFIGTDVTGTRITDANGKALGNGINGVFLSEGLMTSGGPQLNRIGTNGDGFGDVAERNIISGNKAAGVAISAVGTKLNTVAGNYIGTDVTGTLALANGGGGLAISLGATANTIGGTTAVFSNLISGNTGAGVSISGTGTTGNLVEADFIGTNAAGTAALPNGGAGVVFAASGNTLGGTAGAGNLISGNTGDGISLSGNTNQALNNTIGTNAARNARVANRNGISISGANNTVGGVSSAALNVIAANLADGILLSAGATGNVLQNNVLARNNGNGVNIAAGATGNVLLHNSIGTTPSGKMVVPNALNGVLVAGSNNTIGGTTSGSGNLIALNRQDGLLITGSGATGNLVQGNFIGTDYGGTLVLGNVRNGVHLVNASNNTVGGTVAGAANTIANNGNDGVLVDTGTGDAIRQNSISNSGNLGLELLNNGNNGQSFPVLTSVTSDGSTTTTIQGTLTSTPNTTFALEFFANATSNPGGGEGRTFLGAATVTTNGSGTATFSVTLGVGASAGQYVSATATDPNGNTSQFAASLVVPSPTAPGATIMGARNLAAMDQAFLGLALSPANTGGMPAAGLAWPRSQGNQASAAPVLPAPAALDQLFESGGLDVAGAAGAPHRDLAGSWGSLVFTNCGAEAPADVLATEFGT
jgi:hypothetical protein